MKMFLLFILLLPLSAAIAADYTAKAGTTLKTDIEIPEAKIGGGEFYTLTAISEEEVKLINDNGTLSMIFHNAGSYNLMIKINRIVKSSCGGVEATEIKAENISAKIY
jgi:predicted regulator of amino acid metabolism with ACT domain